MNTRFSLVLVDIDSEQAEAIAAAAERELHSLELLMSRFDPRSPVSALNRCATDAPVEPPAELWKILTLCHGFWERTGGAFDITLLPLQQLWRECLQRGQEPTSADLQDARLRSGFNRLHLDSTTRSVHFQAPGMSIDLGGFGKGYALERIATNLRNRGVERAFLSFGESSITALGSHPFGESWPVGIAHMFRSAETVHSFSLCDASLSTSGAAPFNCMEGPREFGQIVDPRTGRPIQGYRTLSVVSSSALEAEILSTALLVTPEQERASLLSAFSAVEAVEIVYHSNDGDFVPHLQWTYGL